MSNVYFRVPKMNIKLTPGQKSRIADIEVNMFDGKIWLKGFSVYKAGDNSQGQPIYKVGKPSSWTNGASQILLRINENYKESYEQLETYILEETIKYYDMYIAENETKKDDDISFDVEQIEKANKLSF